MVDALGAPPSGQAPQVKSTLPATATVELAAPLPQNLLALQAAITATASGRDSPEVLLLQTLQGQLALKTNLTVPAGAKIELRLQEGPPPAVTILSINGTSLRSMSPQANAPAPSAVLDLGTSIEATVLPSSGSARSALPGSPSPGSELLPPGTQLLLRVMGMKSPPGDFPNASAVQQNMPEEMPTEGAPDPISARPVQPNASPTDISQTRVLANAGLSGAAKEASPSLETAQGQRPDTTANILTGKILGPYPGGPMEETLIQTPAGLLAVATRLAAPPGTEVRFERLAENRPTPTETTADQPLALSDSWPALDHALATLETAAPQLAAQFRTDFSVAGERLGPALLFFVGVLKGKTPWPSTAIDQALETAGAKSMHAQVAKDVEELRAIAANPMTGDWQTYVLPLLAGPFVRPARLYVKRRKQDRDQTSSEGEANRFILEVELSRLGALQFDGLVRGMRFDLVLRSQRMLAIELRREISVLFNDTLGSVGYKGGISYAVERRFQIAPLDVFRPHLGVSA